MSPCSGVFLCVFCAVSRRHSADILPTFPGRFPLLFRGSPAVVLLSFAVTLATSARPCGVCVCWFYYCNKSATRVQQKRPVFFTGFFMLRALPIKKDLRSVVPPWFKLSNASAKKCKNILLPRFRLCAGSYALGEGGLLGAVSLSKNIFSCALPRFPG